MEAILERLSKLDVASVSDAMDKLGIPCGLLGLHPVVPGKHICGRAFTVHYVPNGVVKGNVGDFLDDVKPGEVVVIDNGGRLHCTVWGDIMTYVATKNGVAGTIIDGVCRDVPGIQENGYAIFTKSTYMVTGKDRVTVDFVNKPVSISGVQVCPGDIILADDTGAVCIPDSAAERACEIAEGIEAAEQKIIAAVKGGSTPKEARAKLGYHSLQTKED
ncbi:RraA family protein [uncultured Oscillibacter sp.]|uniref:RraA family protein n=1 Tax=uncultured Oscillibacter sp. TaxID=876091 RepID=UPI002612510D|nr:RraA family protein [uncultured Oscillibacter sp.]